jgi:molybdopterin converting factor small subunit
MSRGRPGETMRIRVLLFARYREAAGSEALEVLVPEDAPLAKVWEAVQAQVPALRGERTPLMALDRSYAPADRKVVPGSEVAFFPAVSGG